MQRFESIVKEIQDNMQDMPSEGLRNKIKANVHASITPRATRRRLYAYPVMAAITILLVCGTVFTAYAAGAFDNLRRFERHPSHLDEIPVPVYSGDESLFDETHIHIGDGVYVSMVWREFQQGLQEYGWQRINAGQTLEGRVPEEIWCFCGSPIYMHHRTMFTDSSTSGWARDGWFWQLQSRGYTSEDGTEYIEMERWASLAFICPECDLTDTARYSILFKEYKWMQLSTLDNPYITIDRLQIVDER